MPAMPSTSSLPFSGGCGEASATGRIRCFDTDTGRARNLLEVAPVLSSEGTGWQSLFFERYRLARGELHHHTLLQPTLCVAESGGIRVEVGVDGAFKYGRTETGTIWFYPTGTTMLRSRWEGHYECIVMSLVPGFLEKILRELPRGDALELRPASGIVDQQLYHLAMALKTELLTGCLGGRVYEEGLATALAVHLMGHYSTRRRTLLHYASGLSPYRLRRVNEYIEHHLERDLSLVELAGLIDISPYHFARMFKQSTGVAPHGYVLSKRIERARDLLTDKNLSIVDISQAVGFHNQSHFCAVFHKRVGVTPISYRNACVR